jgi:hypothetical protein
MTVVVQDALQRRMMETVALMEAADGATAEEDRAATRGDGL